MRSFKESIDTLLAVLDPAVQGSAIETLKKCRRFEDVDALAQNGGWLNPQGTKPRLRLVKHGSGTFLILSYDEGWGTTLVQSEFWRR